MAGSPPPALTQLGQDLLRLGRRQPTVALEPRQPGEVAGRYGRCWALVGVGLLDVDERPGHVTARLPDGEHVLVLAALDDDG